MVTKKSRAPRQTEENRYVLQKLRQRADGRCHCLWALRLCTRKRNVILSALRTPGDGGTGNLPELRFFARTTQSDKSKLAAGLLGLFLGGYGVHNFYLGNTKRAVIQLLLTIFTCGLASIWGFVEGILILTGASGYQTDSSGRRLQD